MLAFNYSDHVWYFIRLEKGMEYLMKLITPKVTKVIPKW